MYLDWFKLIKCLRRTKIEYSENNFDTVITKMFKFTHRITLV